MSLYDSNGRLKITLSAPTSSTTSGVSIYENGTLIGSGITGINFIDQGDSHATLATSGSTGVTVTFSHTPIMALSGFRSDLNGVTNVHYFAPNWSTLTGSTTQNFMVACLYKRKYHDVRADIVGKGFEGTDGWNLVSPGNDNANAAFKAQAGTLFSAERQFGFPGDDKWIFAVANYSPTDNYIYVYINGEYAAGVAWTVGSMNTTDPFVVGAQAFTGFVPSGSQFGSQAILISAVAMRTASMNLNYEDNYNYFQAVKEAGDIVGDSRFGWDHIWSVKRNTPGATWTAASGNINLIRHGTGSYLTIVTDSNPRWL